MSTDLRFQKIFMDAFMNQHQAGTIFQMVELTDVDATFVTTIEGHGASDSMIVGRFRLVDQFELTPNISLEEVKEMMAKAEDLVGKNESSAFEDNQVIVRGFDKFVIRRNKFVIGCEDDYAV